MTSAATAEPIRHAPIALWRIARDFLTVLHALFGAPEDVAAKHTLRYEAYALIVSWVRCAEAMLRHLLLIEAQAYAKPNTRPLLHPKRQRARKLMSFTPEAPEKWRVSFRCFLSPTLRQAQGDAEDDAGGSVSVSLSLSKAKRPARISREDRWCSENWKPARFHSAWPIAERYEALLRVYNDPTAYARRLSRRLHATPHRAVELLRAPREAEHRIDNYADFREGAKTASTGFGLDTS